MSYEEVLDLTVSQIAALLTEESLPYGAVDPTRYHELMRSM